MAKRWCIAPVIGSGTKADPYRAKIYDMPKRGLTALIPSNSNGTPKFNWALCLVTDANWTELDADPTIRTVADRISLDLTLASLNTNARNRLINELNTLGVNTVGISQTTTFREILQRIFDTLDPLMIKAKIDEMETFA